MILPSSTTNYDAYDLYTRKRHDWLYQKIIILEGAMKKKCTHHLSDHKTKSTCQYYWEYFHTNDFEDDFFLSKLIYIRIKDNSLPSACHNACILLWRNKMSYRMWIIIMKQKIESISRFLKNIPHICAFPIKNGTWQSYKIKS